MVIKNPKGYNPVEVEKAYNENKAARKAEFGDLNKYLIRIGRKIEEFGMKYETVNDETITFNGHTIKLINSDGEVSFDGEEMKWSQTADKIKAVRN